MQSRMIIPTYLYFIILKYQNDCEVLSMRKLHLKKVATTYAHDSTIDSLVTLLHVYVEMPMQTSVNLEHQVYH